MSGPEKAPVPVPVSDAAQTVQNVQALRGIAALLVVWAHIKFPINTLAPEAGHHLIVQTNRGAIGVDLFFVISGFVISLTAAKRHHSALDFFLARVARVVPLYLVLTLMQMLSKCTTMPPALLPVSVWNGFFFFPIFDWGHFTAPPIFQGWTLSFEFWFYCAFALLLLSWKPRAVAIILPAILLVASPLMSIFYTGAWYLPAFLFHPFVLEFGFGCLVFHLQKWISGPLSWALLAAGTLAAVTIQMGTGQLGVMNPLLSGRVDLAWQRVLLWGVPSACIVAGLIGLERHYRLILPSALVWVGGISYSLYLVHFRLLEFFGKIGPYIGLHNALVIGLALPVACVAAAWLCWLWLERPLTQKAQQWARRIVAARAKRA